MILQNNWFANVVGFVVVIFLCWATGYILVHVIGDSTPLPEQINNIVWAIIGFLTAKLSTVVDWSFGTSSAAKRQGEIIATQANTIAAAQNALPPVPGAPDKVVPIAAGETVAVKSPETNISPQ